MKKIVTLLTICSPLLINAQGFQVNLQGQKQQAMGGAATAMVQDGAALFFNPGAVSFLKENSLSAGGSPVIAHSQYVDGASSVVSETESPVSYPFTGYAVVGKKDSRLKYGFAAYTPFGSTIDWQSGWTGRFIINHLQLQTVFFQPTASYKISDKLGIGAGFVYGIGKLNIRQDLPIVDDKGNYASAELNGNAQGYGFNAGIYYKPIEKLSFGLNYRSQVNMKVNNGAARFAVPASVGAQFPSGAFHTDLPLPKVISLGTAYSPCKKFTVAFDATMVGWKSYDTLSYDFEKNTNEVADMKLVRNYKNTFSYRIGGQYSINNKLDARFGLKYLSTPVQDGYVTPEVPDASHFNYSVGLGYRFNEQFTADMSFTYEQMNRTGTNLQNQLTGTYKTNIFIPGFSINYNF